MSQINAFSPVDSALGGTDVNRFGEMTSEEFVRVIFTELSNQDPFQPNDTGALLDQLNSIRSIESDLKLVSKLEDLVTENQLASASNLLGNYVEGLDDSNNRVEGFAISVIRENDRVMLEIDTGQRLPFDNVQSVIDVSLFQAPPPVTEETESSP